MSNRRTPVLEFFGNGSIVDTASYKHQAGEAPSPKLQAPSKESSKPQAPSKESSKLQAPSHKLQARGACDKLSQDIMSH